MILITGGARSGKSTFAEKLAAQYPSVLYMATAMPFDIEMETRIQQHQNRRPKEWDTLECFLEIPKALRELPQQYDCILLDCVTLWVNNMLFHFGGNDPETMEYELAEERILKETGKLVTVCKENKIPILLVTNELGFGLVPEQKLSRHFRDIAGKVNQLLGEYADEAYFVVSGIPIKIKGED